MNLKELSKLIGMSQTTVSRALNGYPEVSEKTRLLVQTAAIEHNYHPNTRAQGLATGKSKMIGYVLPMSSQHEMLNPIFGDFLAGAAQTYSHKGYDSTLSLTDNDKEAEAYRDLHTKGSVDGVVVQAPRLNDPRIEILKELQLPFVVHGRVPGDLNYPHVDVNNRRAFFHATEFLLDLGHRRIALINGNEHLDFAQRRRAGYEEALSSHGISPDTSLIFADEMTEDFGYRTMTNLLDSHNPPSAALVSSLIMAIGARWAIEEKGLRLGKDFSIVIHDDDLSYLKNGGTIPVFTATRSSVREAGRLCAEILIGCIENPSLHPQSIILEADLIVGKSTGPYRGK